MHFHKRGFILLVLVLFVFLNSIVAQNEQYIIKKISTDNGLPSNIINNCVVDHNGFLWIANQACLARFDGIELKVYNQNNTPSIHLNRFLAIEKESDSSLIAINSLFQLFRINKKSELKLIDNLTCWKDYLVNASCKLVLIKNFPLISNNIIENIKNGNFSLYTTSNNLFYLVNPEKIVFNGQSTIAIDKLKDKPKFFFVLSNQLFYISDSKGIYKLNQDKIEYLSNLTKFIKFKFNINDVSIKPFNDYVSFYIKDSLYLLNQNTGNVKIKRLNISFNGVNSLACYIPEKPSNTMFFSSSNKGLFMIKKNIFNNIKLKYVGQDVLRVTYINNKIFEKPFDEHLNKKLGLNKCVMFNLSKDTVCFFNYDKMVYCIDGKYSYKKIKVDSSINKDYVYDVLPYKNSFIVLTKTQILHLTKNKELKLYLKFPFIIQYACMSEKTKNWIIALENGDVKYYDTKHKSIKTIRFLKDKSVRYIKYDSNLNCFWIFTYGMGVFIMDNDLKITSLDIDKKGYLNYSHYVLQDLNNYYWIPTNNGIFRFKQTDLIKKIKNLNYTISFNFFSIEDGLMNNEFNGRFLNSGVVLPNGHFALSNVDGIVTFNPNQIKNEFSKSPILIDNVLLNKKNLGIINNLIITAGTHKLEIKVVYADFDNIDLHGIEYTLSDDFSVWYSLEGNKLELSNLANGKYKIYFRKSGNNDQSEFVSFQLTVLPPWYSSNYAFIVYFILFVFLGYLISRYNIKNRQLKLKNELMLLESELKALRSQINPHYLSNSLVSLQQIILKDNKLQAMEVLSKYGKVMRSILNNSEHPFVSIYTEISTLKEYMELEALLLFENAEFSIHYDTIDNELLQTIQIPSMLIQPYVENAIIHGLLPKNSPPYQLIVSFEFNERLICTIQDNGVGRSPKVLNIKKISKGNENVENRMKLYGKLLQQTMKVEIIDLKNELNESIGTKVVIVLPHGLIEKNTNK
jgi:hypothetical protein